MPYQVVLQRKSTEPDTKTGNCLLVLEITSAQNMEREVFVKQRINVNTTETKDVFVAVATPALMEDLDKNSPAAGTSYFRTSKVEVVCFSIDFADTLANDIRKDVELLVQEMNQLDVLKTDATYTITG